MKTADNLKVGDKVKCIKTFKTILNDLIYFNENDFYEIKNVMYNTVEIITNYGLTLILRKNPTTNLTNTLYH